MAKNKKKVVKRKPSSTKVLQTVVKGGKELVKSYDSISDLLKSTGKPSTYKGKMTKNAKSELINKTLSDVADKNSIKAAKSGANKSKMKAKADSKELKRGIKSTRKDAGREKALLRAKNKMTDVKNATKRKEVERKAKQAKTKDKLVNQSELRKGLRETQSTKYKKSKASIDASKARNEKKLAEAKKPSKPVAPLVPHTNKNIKKTVKKVDTVKKADKVKQKKPLSPNAKAGGAGAALIAGGLGVKKLREGEKSKGTTDKTAQNDTSREVVTKSKPTGGKPTGGKPTGKPERNDHNKKTPEVNKPKDDKPKQNLEQIKKDAVDAYKRKNGKNPSPARVESAMAKARAYKAKNKDVPWEKILESLTMILSSHLLGRGISKRYK